MKINIVTEPPNGWVLRMMAERWAEYLPDCTITSMIPNENSDINFYVNWDIFSKPTNIDVGWFTHRDSDNISAQRFDAKALAMDYCICPSIKTLELLPKNKSCILKHGIGKQYKNKKNKISFGIVGREYDSGRKQFNIVPELKKIPNCEFFITNGTFTDEQMPDFYNSIDYLLILSNNEGGPVPVLEAFAIGKPVIAPDVGWCWEYPVIKYNTIDELKILIKTLSIHIDNEQIWKKSSQKLLNIFRVLLERKNYQKL